MTGSKPTLKDATVQQLAVKIDDQARTSGGSASPEERAEAKVATFKALWPALGLVLLALAIGIGELWTFRGAISKAVEAQAAGTLIVILLAFAVLPGICVVGAIYHATRVDHEGVRAALDVLKRGRNVARGEP